MQINLYRFLIELYFKPPMPVESYLRAGIQYEGFEQNYEEIYASSPEVALRSMQKIVRKKIGAARPRLVSLDIKPLTEEEYVEICETSQAGEESHGKI